MHFYVLTFVAALALNAPAQAAIVYPADGQFAVPGAPAFIASAWTGVSESKATTISMVQQNQIAIWAVLPNLDAWLLEPDPPLTNIGIYNTITSFQCLDSNTAVLSMKGIRLTGNRTSTITSCTLMHFNGTNLIARWLIDPGKDDIPRVCPDTPFGDFKGVMTTVSERVPDVLPVPTTLVCKNESATPADLLDVVPALPKPSSFEPPPRTPYPLPGGAPVASGVWKAGNALYIVSATEYATIEASPPGAPAMQELAMRMGVFTDHQCLGKESERSFSGELEYFLNGTVAHSFTCELTRRDTLSNGTTLLHLMLPTKNLTDCPPDLFDSPDAITMTLTMVKELSWKHVTECVAGGTSPSPQPSPAPPSSAAGLVALPAVLMVMLSLLL